MILVIGGMGFIGLNTVLRFLEVGESVVITQHSARRIPDVLNDEIGKRVFVERLDVTSAFELFDVVKRNKVDSIVSFAAPPARGISPHVDYHIYAAGLQNTLEAARVFEMKRVSLASSQSVYGSLKSGPYTEDMPLPLSSKNQIEAFKKGMEVHASHYASRANLDVVFLRIGSIYGPLYYSMFNPASRMVHAALKGVEPDFSDRPNAVIMEDDEGDWTYVKDLARGIQMVHMHPRLQYNTYNIGSGRTASNKQTFEAVKKVLPEARLSAMKPGRTPGMPEQPYMDLTRIKQDVGYTPEYDIEKGIAAYVEWLRKNPQ